MAEERGGSAPEASTGPKGDPRWLVGTLRVILLVLLGGIGWLLALTPPGGGGVDELPGGSLPDFTLDTLDGRQISRADLRGKVTVLNFFATWCGPCRMEMPDLVDLHEDLDGGPVQILGVSAGYDEVGELKPFLKEFRVSFPVLLHGELLMGALKRGSLPTTVVVGPDLAIRAVFEGAVSRGQVEVALAGVGGLPGGGPAAPPP